jgi:hypothetical protein
MTYPLRHVSIRVPWHDTGWDGRVCAAPRLNGACLKLKRIAGDRNDSAEEAVAGKSLKDLPFKDWPCCVSERVAFMAPFEYTRAWPIIRITAVQKLNTDTLRHHLFAIHPIRHPLCRSHGC